MKSKIENSIERMEIKMDLIIDIVKQLIPSVKIETSDKTEFNSQDQEEEKIVRSKEDIERTDYTGYPYSKEFQSTTQDTPEEWEEELMEIIGEATDLDEITNFIKQLLEEREMEVKEDIRNWIAEYKNDTLEVLNIDVEILRKQLIDEKLSKLNTKKK